MHNILIADKSDDLCAVLERMFQREFQVTVCNDADSALSLMQSLPFDALILDLSLPGADGITLLTQLQGCLPSAVLALSDYSTGYLQQTVADLGVKQILVRPFRKDAAYLHIKQMLRFVQQHADAPIDRYSIIAAHLDVLGIPSSRDGYQQLRQCILHYAQDPAQRLSKELYPSVADLLTCSDGRTVEHSIRACIQAAWHTRDAQIWEKYFPGATKCPSNKLFISRISNFIDMSKL